MLRAHRHGVERQRQRRIAARRTEQPAHRLPVWRQQLNPAHQHVEQPLARRFLLHVGIDFSEHLAVKLLDLGAEDRKRRSEFAAQVGQRDAGALGDFGQADALDRLLGEQHMKASMMRSRGEPVGAGLFAATWRVMLDGGLWNGLPCGP